MLIEFFLLWSSVKSAKRKLSADSFTSPVVLLETVDQGQIEYKHFYSINYQEDAESARRNCRAGGFSKRKKPQRGARARRAIKPQKNDVSVTTQGLHFYHKIDLKELTCTCNEEISKLERKIDRLTKLVRRLKDKPKNNKLQSSKEPLQIPEIAPVTEKPVVTTTEEVKIVRCPNDCSGNGKCDEKTGLCSCDESWLGEDCAEKICPKNCNNQGECVDGACKCHQKSDGRFWTGPACETLACFDDCNGRGSCLNGVCDCDLPWFGKDCSERKCLKPCQNGFCVDGTCKCAKGFTGIDCSEKTCPNNCSKHGTCKNGVCQCRNIWKGKDCSIRTCAIGSLAKGEPAKLCFGHGECDEKTGTCNCWNQFTGFNCARKKCIPACTGNRICNGRTGRCLCRRNWHGEDCNVPRCPNNCNNGNGRCNPKTGTCTCKPNWTGDDCSIPACNKECQHESICIGDTCVCGNGWTGEFCEKVAKATNVNVTLNSPDSFTIKWESPAPEVNTGAEINCVPDSEGSITVYKTVGPNQTAITINDLEEGTTYTINLYMKIGDLVSPPTSRSITTGIQPPRNIKATQIFSDKVSIRWESPEGKVDKFKLICSCSGGGSEYEFKNDYFTHKMTNLAPDTEYNITMWSETNNGKQSRRETLRFKTLKQTSKLNTRSYVPHQAQAQVVADLCVDITNNGSFPSSGTSKNEESNRLYPKCVFHQNISDISPPSDVEVKQEKYSTISVTWRKEALAQGYYIEVFSGNEQVAEYRINHNEIFINASLFNLHDDHVFKIYSIDQFSKRSSPTIKTMRTLPLAPKNLKIVKVTHESVSATWQKQGSETDGLYRVVLEDLSTQTPLQFNQLENEIKITKLRPANEYLFSVFTVSADEESLSLPSQAIFMTSNDPPVDFAALKVTSTSALLTWTPPIAATSAYHIIVTNDGGNIVLKKDIPAKDTASYQLEGLSEGTEFTVSLKSIPLENRGLAPPSEVSIKFQTTFPAPESYSLSPGVEDLKITFTHSHSDEVTFKLIEMIPASILDQTRRNTKSSSFSSSDIDYIIALENLHPKYYRMNNEKIVHVMALKPETEYMAEMKYARGAIEGKPEYFKFKTKSEQNSLEITFLDVKSDSALIIWDIDEVDEVDSFVLTYGAEDIEIPAVPEDVLIPEQHLIRIVLEAEDTAYTLRDLEEDTRYHVVLEGHLRGELVIQEKRSFSTKISAPENIQMVFKSSSEATITWEDKGFYSLSTIDKQYKVEYASATRISPENLVPGESSLDWNSLTVSKNSVSLKNLEPLTKYRIRVAALGKAGQVHSAFREIEIMTDPAPVQGLRLYRAGIRWLKFVWDAPEENVDGYEVTLLDEIGFDQVKQSKIVKTTSWRFEGLDASTWYRVQVKALSGPLKSLPRVILGHTELHEPRQVKVTEIKESSAKILWEPVDQKTSGRVTLSSENSPEKVISVGAGQNIQELLYLAPNTEYNVKVQLKKNRILSEVAEIEFRTEMPEQIPILKLVQVEENEATLGWEENETGSYRLSWRKLSEDTFASRQVEGGTGRIFNLSPGEDYLAKLETAGTENSSVLQFRTLEKLLPVKNFKVEKVGTNTATVSWERNGVMPDKYVLVQRNEYSESKIIIEGDQSPEEKKVVTKLKHLFYGLKYQLTLYSAKEKQRSESVKIEFETWPKLKDPTNLTINYTTPAGGLLSWSMARADLLDGYLLTVFNKSSQERSPVAVLNISKNATEYLFDDLLHSSKYKIVLQAIRGDESSKKTEAIFRTSTELKPISKCSASNVNENFAKIHYSYDSMEKQPNVFMKYTISGTRLARTVITKSSNTTGTFELTNLQPSTDYIVEVRTQFPHYASPPCIVNFRSFSKLTPPYQLEVSNLTNSSFHLEWSSLADHVDNFHIEILNTASSRIILNRAISAKQDRIDVAGLYPATKYSMELWSVRQNKKSKRAQVSTTTKTNPPQIIYRSSTEEDVTVTVVKPRFNINNYIVTLMKDNGDDKENAVIRRITVSPGDDSARRIKLRQLKPSTNYIIEISSVLDSQKSEPCSVSFRTAPGSPKDLRAEEVTDESAKILWTPVDEKIADTIQIEVRKLEYGQWKFHDPGFFTLNSSRKFVTLPQLEAGAPYQVKAKLINEETSESAFSTIEFRAKIDGPKNVEVLLVERYSAQMRWAEPIMLPAIVNIKMVLLETESGKIVKNYTLPPKTRSFSFDELQQGTEYTVTLQSIGKGDEKSTIKKYNFKTKIYNHRRPETCVEVLQNGFDQDGVYTIFIGSHGTLEAPAYCRQKIAGGGWQVIQQRSLQTPYIQPLMKDYVEGFGRADSDFWIGLDTMSILTEKPKELLIYIRDIYGAEQIARYSSVKVASKEDDYVIQIGRKLDGDIEDDWTMMNGRPFGNFDHNRPLSCIDPLAYGWWHLPSCRNPNFNIFMGRQRPIVRRINPDGVVEDVAVAEAAMMIRPPQITQS